MAHFKGSHIAATSGSKLAELTKVDHPTVLHFARSINGLSVERLAQKTGIGESRLRNMENGIGDNWTSPGEAAALERTFGAPEKELLAPGTSDNCFAYVRRV